MPTMLSRKKLSTLKGQQVILASIALDKTMGDSDGKFQGDPSLRVLLADEIKTFPFTDELFEICTKCDLRSWEDSRVQHEWLTSVAYKVTSTRIVAEYYNRYSYHLKDSLVQMDRGILRKVVWSLSSYTLRTFIDSAIELGVLEPMYLAAEIKMEESDDCSVERHFREAVTLWKDNPQALPGLAHMVNVRIKNTMNRYKADGLSSLFLNLSGFFERKIDGLRVTLDLRPPEAYRDPKVLEKFIIEEEE